MPLAHKYRTDENADRKKRRNKKPNWNDEFGSWVCVCVCERVKYVYDF